MLRYLSGGESHGPGLVAIIEGLPAGIPINLEDINEKLRRRQGGYGRGGRMKIEKDQLQILSGIRGSYTLGSPVSLLIENKDWVNWQEIMDPLVQGNRTERVVTSPRPGHADLPGAMKYRQRDLRNVLERASARETAVRVAVGALAQGVLEKFQIKVEGQVISIGKIRASYSERIMGNRLYEDPLYCPDSEASARMITQIDQAREKGDTLGGVFQIVVEGLPPGIGSHVHWDRRLDAQLAQGIMAIPAVKGVEIGLGFAGSERLGSQVHDEIGYSKERGFRHFTNNAGGIEGGISNGENLIIRAAMKPIPTLTTPLGSVDINTKVPSLAVVERSDVCAVPAAAIVGEAVVAWVIVGSLFEKFGGDHLDETLKNYQGYLKHLQKWPYEQTEEGV